MSSFKNIINFNHTSFVRLKTYEILVQIIVLNSFVIAATNI